MSPFIPANVADSERSLFSPDEMKLLMRGEFYRARRYDYPLTCMVVQVDRLGSLQDLYGIDSKREILRGTVELLSSVTRESDYFGCVVDDRLLTIFPHTDRAASGALAWRLLHGARQLQFDSDGRLIQITLSVGAADASGEGVHTYEDLVRAAEEGVAVALRAGGDRYIVREEVQTELHRLRSRLGELKGLVGAAADSALSGAAAGAGAGAGAAAVEQVLSDAGLGDDGDEALVARIRAAFSTLIDERTPELEELEHKIITVALREMRDERTRSVGVSSTKYEKQISLLERRIAKLDQLLGRREQELAHVKKLKAIDPGLASIYRVVQGLDEGDSSTEIKKLLMHKIFEANIELRGQLGSKP